MSSPKGCYKTVNQYNRSIQIHKNDDYPVWVLGWHDTFPCECGHVQDLTRGLQVRVQQLDDPVIIRNEPVIRGFLQQRNPTPPKELSGAAITEELEEFNKGA